MGLEGNTNAYAITGASPFMWSFLGIEYRLSEVKLPNAPLWELLGSAQDRKGGTTYLYRNLYTLPLGYLIPDDVDTLWTPSANNPVRTQNSYANLAANVGNIFDTVKANISGATMTAVADKAGYYVAYVGSSSVKKVTASVNGQNSKVWDSLNRNYLVDYGYLEEGDDIKMVASDVSSMSVTLYRLNEKNFIQAVETLSSHPFVIDEWIDETFKTQVRGHVTAEKNSQLVFSIPIDKGWRIEVDGKKAEMADLADSWIGVMLTPGEHEIVLTYVPEGLESGVLLSAAGIGILLICLAISLIVRSTKKLKETQNEEAGEPQEEPMETHFAEKLAALEEEDGAEAPDDAEAAGTAAPPAEEAEEAENPAPEKPAAALSSAASEKAPSSARSRIASLHRYDEEERLRDKGKGKLPVLAFDGDTVYPRYVSPAERQKDEALLTLPEEENRNDAEPSEKNGEA